MTFLKSENIFESWAVALVMAFFVVLNFGGNDGKNFSKVNSVTCNVGVWDVSNWNTYGLSHDICRELRMYISLADTVYGDLSAEHIRESRLEEQIAEEKRLGEIELLAQLVEAEAGNQDMKGKRLVADVVLNRLEEGWGDTIEQIIFDDGQFSCVDDGNFEKAGWNISEESYEVARMEYEAGTGKRLDNVVLYFTAGGYNKYCVPMYKYGGHYFGK